MQLKVCERGTDVDDLPYVGYLSSDKNLMIGASDDRIDAVHAFKKLNYGGTNLLGRSERAVRKLLDVADWTIVKSKSGKTERLESPTLGAVFFIEKGKVDSAILSPIT